MRRTGRLCLDNQNLLVVVGLLKSLYGINNRNGTYSKTVQGGGSVRLLCDVSICEFCRAFRLL